MSDESHAKETSFITGPRQIKFRMASLCPLQCEVRIRVGRLGVSKWSYGVSHLSWCLCGGAAVAQKSPNRIAWQVQFLAMVGNQQRRECKQKRGEMTK